MGSVLIESRLVGKLIGPRGATIQQLQSEYNVHISISKEDDQVSNRRALEKSHKLIASHLLFRMETARLRSEDPTMMSRTLSKLFKKDSVSPEVVVVAVVDTDQLRDPVEILADTNNVRTVTLVTEAQEDMVANNEEDTNNEKTKVGEIVAGKIKANKAAVQPGNHAS